MPDQLVLGAPDRDHHPDHGRISDRRWLTALRMLHTTDAGRPAYIARAVAAGLVKAHGDLVSLTAAGLQWLDTDGPDDLPEDTDA